MITDWKKLPLVRLSTVSCSSRRRATGNRLLTTDTPDHRQSPIYNHQLSNGKATAKSAVTQCLAEVGQRLLQAFQPRDLRFPAQNLARPPDIGAAPSGIVFG